MDAGRVETYSARGAFFVGRAFLLSVRAPRQLCVKGRWLDVKAR